VLDHISNTDVKTPLNQDCVVYKIPWECGKVYIGETGRAMQERIREHDREIRLVRAQTSANFGTCHRDGAFTHFGQSQFYWSWPSLVHTKGQGSYIQIRLHSNNARRDRGIEIPEAWITTFKKHNSLSVTMRTYERTASQSRNNNEDRNAPIAANQRAQIASRRQSTSSPDEDYHYRRDQHLKVTPSWDKRVKFIFPTYKFVKTTPLRVVFLTLCFVFENVVKHGLSCFIYYVKHFPQGKIHSSHDVISWEQANLSVIFY